VHATVAADTYFPELAAGEWDEEVIEERAADDRHAFPFSYVVQRRRR
jgi:dihydrofolate reductase